MFRAVETLYRGCRFRSRTEARWAVFYDFLHVQWSHELERYHLADGTTYMPDFYLPEAKVWVEVKGEYPTGEEQEKAKGLAVGSGKPVLLYFGPIPYSPSQLDFKTSGIFIFHPTGEFGPIHDFVPWFEAEQREAWIEDALEAARSARFEPGRRYR